MNPRSILVVGHDGFIGRRLCALLSERYPKARLVGLDMRSVRRAGWKTFRCDLRRGARLAQLLNRLRPDWIFHMAGNRVVDDPAAMIEGHLSVTANLLQAAAALRGSPRVILPGSAGEYGIVPRRLLPVAEDAPANPITFYGAVKASQSSLAKVYAHRGLDVVLARIFNILGPGGDPEMAVHSFVRQIVRIENGRRPAVLETGDLSVKRDFVDVDDTALALVRIAQRGKTGEAYNVCSGSSVTLAHLVRELLNLAQVPITLKTKTERLRAVDIPDMRGSTRKSARELGFKCGIPLRASLRAMLEHDRRLAE